MTDFSNIESDFLRGIVSLIEENLEDENFGVSELAAKADMSRSTLLRKIQKLTDVSASVFIRHVRLHTAKGLLQNDTLNVSEVSYKVGFNSVSYFIKCYKEEYGYPPGEEGKQKTKAPEPTSYETVSTPPSIWTSVAIVAGIFIALLTFFFLKPSDEVSALEKSIAVLPFKNDSNDSSNVYIVNGLMEAVLNNLQKIEDLRVISRTSVERYRNRSMTMAEIANELDVNYVIEGSGQKLGDQLLLTIQLIEAPIDKHLWSERYSRQALDIFALQTDVAKDIAEEIKVFITPEEERLIDKVPTENLVAYDYYLKGIELTKHEKAGNLENAIDYFKMAIVEDSNFAHPYAAIAISYFYLDFFLAQKKYLNEMNTYADKALLLDSELGESLIAKGLFYSQDGQYELAVEYFEKVLEFQPNSADAYIFLSDVYSKYLPNTEKYLKYALKGVQLDRTGIDSVTTSNSYLHLSNALAQNGFLKEAEHFIDISLVYNPKNPFSQYLKAYILLGQHKNFRKTRDQLIQILNSDTTRLDIMQEVAKVCYAMEDYETSSIYYDKFAQARKTLGSNIFESEDVKIGFVLNQLGRNEEAKQYLDSYRIYAENDQSIYGDLAISAYYASVEDIEKSIHHLKKFSEQENYQYWFVLFLERDPIMNVLNSHPEYQSTIKKITDKFWNEHKQMRSMLEEEGLL